MFWLFGFFRLPFDGDVELLLVVFLGVEKYAIPLALPAIQNISGLGVDLVHRAFMAGVSLAVLASPILASLLLRDYSELAKNEARQKKRGHLRTLLKFSFLNGLLGFGTGLIIPLIPTWFLLKFGVQDTYTGPLLALASLTVALSAAISPRLSRRYGLVKSIVMVQGVATVFMISLGFAPIPLLAASFFVTRAGFMYMGNPLADSYLMGIMEAQERGLASAVNSVMWELPQSASTILGGVILGSGSYTSPFLLVQPSFALWFARMILWRRGEASSQDVIGQGLFSLGVHEPK